MQTNIETQKITAILPKKALQEAQEFTGAGITETIKQALEDMVRKKAYQDLLNLKGKVKFSLSLKELRYDRGDD